LTFAGKPTVTIAEGNDVLSAIAATSRCHRPGRRALGVAAGRDQRHRRERLPDGTNRWLIAWLQTQRRAPVDKPKHRNLRHSRHDRFNFEKPGDARVFYRNLIRQF
jgi:hypothetical protein